MERLELGLGPIYGCFRGRCSELPLAMTMLNWKSESPRLLVSAICHHSLALHSENLSRARQQHPVLLVQHESRLDIGKLRKSNPISPEGRTYVVLIFGDS